MSLLPAPIVKKSHIMAGIYFIFLKKRPIQNLEVFKYQIWTSVKRQESPLSSKINLAFFCNLGGPILS